MPTTAAPELLAAIVDSSDDGIVSKTLTGKITSWNRGAERIFGYTAEEAIGRHISFIFPPERLAEEAHLLSEVGAGRRVEHFETWRRRKDGRLIPVSVTLSPVRDGGGEIVGVSKIVRDITERVRRQAAEQLLGSLNEAIRSLRDPDEVMRSVVAMLGSHLGANRCAYAEADPGERYLSFSHDFVDGVPSTAGRHRLDDYGVPVVRELEARRTVAIEDVLADERTRDVAPAYAAMAVRAMLCVPLVKAGRLVALLSVQQHEPRRWSDDDIALVEHVAERMWFAVETVRAERALRESRDVLSLAMRGGRLGAWSRDLVTNEVRWSRELEELFGVPPGAFDGTTTGFLPFVHEEDRPVLDAAVAAAIASRGDYIVEFRFRHASGVWRWMEGRGRAVYADDGTPLTLHGIGIDITERKRFEEALAAARDAADADAERLNMVLAAARLGDWQWDAETDLVTLSPRAQEILELPQAIGWTQVRLRELIHVDDREAVFAAVREALEAHLDFSQELRVVSGGRERWVTMSGRGRYEEGGRLVGMFGVVQDITADRLLVRVDDAVRPLTDPGEITYTAARLLGQHLNVNRCAYATVDADEDSFTVSGNYTAGTHSIVGRYRFSDFGGEYLQLMRDGLPFVVSDVAADPRFGPNERSAFERIDARAILCVPIRKSRRLVAAMALHTNVPREWRPGEIALLRQVSGRCWESIERARVLGERASLLEAAEAANRAKDEFLAMLGHELRNPLAPILTAIQLMKLRGDESSARERTVIERQVSHLTRLVDDLLDVSRIARGKVELKTELVEISEIVARAIEVASPLLEERSHTLTVDVPKSGLLVEGDSARLSQVVSNLLTNAAKYTPAAGRVVVWAKREGGEVVLGVRDSGIGIPAEVLPRVFDLFVQAPQSIDRANGGLGLGLTIVRSLVERHRGHITAHSDGPGRGSEFVVRLPRATSAARRQHSSVHIDAQRLALRGDGRILIVDDNRDAAEMLSEVLRSDGYDTRVAHDGPEALKVAASFRPTAAFLDIGLPVMDGYELASRLRELPGLDGIRLIAVTGYGQPADRERTALAGFQYHIVKPVDLELLQQIVGAARSASA